MKQIIQNLGLLIFIIAIVLLVIGLFKNVTSNTILIISGVLMLAGLFVHVAVNKKLM